MGVLAIDQGTTSTRALVLEDDGRLSPRLSLTHRQNCPAVGYVEHDGEELLGNVSRCLAAAGKDITAVGLDNQGESCLAWDAQDGRPISPVIVWQDDRTATRIKALETEGTGADVMARAGLPLDSYFSASKFGWIMENIPEAGNLARRGRLRLGTTDAFFRDRLTGKFETDVTTASRTSLMNLAACQWDDELCRIFGVPRSALPAIGPSSGALGLLPGDLPLTASIVDQQAALYGHGCRKAGDAKITFGTGAFAQCVTGKLVRPEKPGPLPTVAWQKAGREVVYGLDGGVSSAAAAVNWARELGLFKGFDEISAFHGPPVIDRGLVFVPALTGLGCPHWNRAARGAWLGLGLADGATDMMQALLEGVALRAVEVLASIEAVQPVGEMISVDGGMTANAYFTSLLADVSGRELAISKEAELTALGVAHLAAEAAGIEIAINRQCRTIRPTGDARLASRRQAVFAAARKCIERFAAECS